MKKLLSVFIILLVLCVNIQPAFCVDTSIKVYDDAGLFSDSELESLQNKAQQMAESNRIDVVIVTIDDSKGKTSKTYAENFYDNNGFGYGDDANGILLLIDMDNRKAWITTTGEAIKKFEPKIDSMLDKIAPKLTDGEYAKAASIFLDQVLATINKFQRAVSHLFIYILIGLGIGGVSVGIMAINNKGKKTTTADTYLDKNSFNLMDNRDIYIRTAVTKRHIDTSSGSRGSSGGGGRSHGGGGRSF